MTFGYINNYFEEDYFEEDLSMAITPLPEAPSRSQAPAEFIEVANSFLAAFPQFALELDSVARAMSLNSTNSTSVDSRTIADTGVLIFTVQPGKSYVVGMAVRVAYTTDGTIWMQGDTKLYNAVTGELQIAMNAKQGSGTYAAWTVSMSSSVGVVSGGSLLQDYAVKSLSHAIGANIASAATLNLSTASGNFAIVTGNNTINAVTMSAGKDVWIEFSGTPILTYHATNLKLNSGGANVTAAAGDRARFSFDGTTVTVTFIRLSGKALVETAAPAGLPVGSFLLFAASSPPTDYLQCPVTQTNISRTTYATLFAAIGTTWGSGDGSTTFGLPWFAEDYALLQANASGGKAVGSASTGTIKSHTHSYSVFSNAVAGNGSGGSAPQLGNDPGGVTGATGGTANLAAGSRILICVKYR